MINNMILTMQSNIQLTKNGDNNVNRSKYKSSQVSDFRNIMKEAKNNIKSSVSKKVHEKQERYVRNDNKLDSVGKENDFNDNEIKNNELEKNTEEAKNKKAIKETINEEKSKIENEGKDFTEQVENILNLVNVILKDVNATNQESNSTISDQQITEINSLLDKIRLNKDLNSFLSSVELNSVISKLEEVLVVEGVESKDFSEISSFKKLKLELESLLNEIDKKGTKENEKKNPILTELDVQDDSNINAKQQDLTNAINRKKPSNSESSNKGIEVHSTEQNRSKDNQKIEKVDEKIQISAKTDTGKHIQKVLQKVIVEPKDSFTTDVKFDNIVKNGIDKVNLVEKPNPLYKMEILKQIIDKAQVLLGDNMSEMDMQLRPESLGKLSLKVVMEKGLMSAKFIAESQQVKEIIESNFNQLKDMLQQKGIDIQNLSVSVGQQNRNHNDKNGYRAWKDSISSSSKSKLSMSFEDDIAKLFVETENPYEYHEGSVDYKA